jgi:hypothetical protein
VSATERARRLLPALWAGSLMCIALVATPAPFATLLVQDAGRVVSRIFAQEAYLSIALGAICLLFERRAAASPEGQTRMSTEMLLVLAALFCTVAGYFALQPMMTAARQGQGGLTFGQLHAISLAFFGIKTLAVLALAWRVAAPVSRSAPSS